MVPQTGDVSLNNGLYIYFQQYQLLTCANHGHNHHNNWLGLTSTRAPEGTISLGHPRFEEKNHTVFSFHPWDLDMGMP